jgi:hypothetical protein
LLDLARQLARHHGYRLGTDIPLYFLQEAPETAAEPEVCVTYPSAQLVPTANPSFSLLLESPAVSSQVVATAIQELLDIQEDDLACDRWERPTRILLEGIAPAP